MFDYKEIFEAWVVSFNPTDIEKELATKRLSVCMGCEQRREVLKGVNWSAYCNACGCPLNKKIFAKMYNTCPQKKWKDVDSNYIKPLEDKDNKSII